MPRTAKPSLNNVIPHLVTCFVQDAPHLWPAAAGTILFVLALLAQAEPSRASNTPVCDVAAARAAQESDVPLPVLLALTRTETGRDRGGHLVPWPWAVNMEGSGRWFETREQARAHVARHHARGARSFDVGCFQINFKWHGDAFDSIDTMFDPVANARYAAAFMTNLHAELGNWSDAAGAYHSRTPALAARYRARFDRILAGLPATGNDGRKGGARAPLQRQTDKRQPRRALVDGLSQAASRGSLVPVGGGSARALVPGFGGRLR